MWYMYILEVHKITSFAKNNAVGEYHIEEFNSYSKRQISFFPFLIRDFTHTHTHTKCMYIWHESRNKLFGRIKEVYGG